jgi:hypothetical protein
MSFIGSWIGGALGYVSGFIYSSEVTPEIRISLTPHSLAILPENCVISEDIELSKDDNDEDNDEEYTYDDEND